MRGLWTRMSSFLSRRSPDPSNPVKKFTKAHRRALEYADLKISLEELRQRQDQSKLFSELRLSFIIAKRLANVSS